MEKRARRQFSAEFKKIILHQIASGEKTLSDISKEHELDSNIIARWRREAREGALDARVAQAPKVERQGVDPRYVRQIEEELRKSREKIGELTMEIDILKKLDQFSQRMKNANSSAVTDVTLAQLKRRAK